MVSNVSDQIEKFQEFVEANYKEELHKLISKGKKSIIIDFNLFAKFDFEFAEELLNEPEETLKAVEVALSQIDELQNYSLNIRFANLPESQTYMIKDIRSEQLGRLIAIDGIVKQASEVRPRAISAKFECPSCGNIIKFSQTEEKFREPSRCSCGRKGRFKLLSKDLIDNQRIVLEEIPESLEGGEQPKRIQIFLKEDLVEPRMEKKTTPGSKVRALGIVSEIPIQAHGGGILTRYEIGMDANNIIPLEQNYAEILVEDEDIKEIKKMAKDPQIYNRLVKSIAPTIWGHDKIKLGIVLQLFGGVRKIKKDNTTSRGDLHILAIGDPGSGKSAILQFVSKAAPKCRFVSGKGASGTGLTATLVKDDYIRGWALEGGALVLANQGIAIIDEMDKIGDENTSSLHEAMEQQQVSIAKANIQATLRCQTSILAAANPKYGRFDPFKPPGEQIDLPSTLINRFDLIYVVRDLPNKDIDDRIASHVLQVHKDVNSAEPDIQPLMLKKYIAYAKILKPKLSDEAILEIKTFYVNLRNSVTDGDNPKGQKSIPISARQLEALVRLSEASAKIRLSTEVTQEDAKRAVGLLMESLQQVGIDPETGQIDIDRISSGMSSSKRNKILTIKDIIENLTSKGLKTIPIEDILALGIEKGMKEHEVNEIVEKLKTSGDVFSPRSGYIEKI